MVHISIIEARLSKIGFRPSRWFRPEIKELQNILMDGEQLVGCVQGRYFGGFALLVATDHRLLLIDKKIPYLSVEDIRYDMISEIGFSARWLDSTINIYTVNKQHRFSSWKHKHHLRALTSFAQQRVMELRQYQHQGSLNSVQTPSMAPTFARSYNMGRIQQPQSPILMAAQHAFRPSVHTPQLMGATALNGARRWINPNPYTRGSLIMRNQLSRSD